MLSRAGWKDGGAEGVSIWRQSFCHALSLLVPDLLELHVWVSLLSVAIWLMSEQRSRSIEPEMVGGGG